MPVVIASDHAGYQLKKRLVDRLVSQGIETEDLGPFNDQVCDYPLMARKVVNFMQNNLGWKGVLVCGSSLGMCIAANRFPGVRAIAASTAEHARLGRSHNNGNVLCLGGRLTPEPLALEILDVFLNTDFEGGRHQARVDMLDML